MVRKRGRYENAGRLQSIFTVNFRETDEILTILNSFRGNEAMEGHIADLYIKMQAILIDYDFTNKQKSDVLEFAIETLDDKENDDEILSTSSRLIEKLSPGSKDRNTRITNTFLCFVCSLPPEEQMSVYEGLGKELNNVLYEQTKESTKIQDIDLLELLKTSSKDMFENADNRLKSFIFAAVKTDERNNRNHDSRNVKRMGFCSNIVENLLKARNLKFVSLSGLALQTLVYILSGRSKQTCNLFSSTGAKGSYRLVKEYVLPNSKETSYKNCEDGVTVYYSFDNAQKLFKTWRLHGSANDKSLAMVATSVVHCYPDGLLASNVQYVLRHSPMIWLHSFEINQNGNYLVEKLDTDILKSLINLDQADEDIILGRFDLEIDLAIRKVKEEKSADGRDFIDLVLEVEEKELQKEDRFCEDGHRNVKPRGNQIKCKVCRKNINKTSDNTVDEEYETLKDTLKQIVVRNDAKNGKMHDILIEDAKVSKAKIYPRVRNQFNENPPIYRSQGMILANPNTFPRVKLVLRGIKNLTGTSKVHNSSITFTDDKNIEVKTWGVHNMRSWIVITVDGLPHKLLIEVIKHSFICEECGKDFDVISDVTEHFQKYKHKTYFKEFGNCIIKIGGLHAEMNMLRSFVSLTWKIYYSFLCKALGFLSPKAQLVQAKVTDMHKGWDTFMSQRFAILREIVKLFVDHASRTGIEANSESFEVWEKNIKNDNLRLVIQLQKYFGTGLWLYRAGTRSNHYKITRAGIRVFSGLFHINGNLNYSVIELYDDYMMTSMEKKNPDLFNHFYTRMVTNLNNEEYCSESHDARHEEANKRAQNLLSGKDLEEFDLAFTIVDDLEEMRSKYLGELGIEDRTQESTVVIPDYEEQVRDMRISLRKTNYLKNPQSVVELESVEGHKLNKSLLDVFQTSRDKRNSDILNVIRYSDFSKGYNSKSRIPILEVDKENETTVKEIEDQILILLHCIEDKEEKDVLTETFLNGKNGKPKSYFIDFLSSLIDQTYSNLIESENV